MSEIVVPPNPLRTATLPDAFDHRRMVLLVGEDDGALQEFDEGRKRGFVRNIARGKEQRGFLAVKIGQLFLKLDVEVRGARNIARAARAGADLVDGFVHCLQHGGMLPHAKVIVRAPYRYRARTFRLVMHGLWEIPPAAQDIGKNPVPSLCRQSIQCVRENAIIVHESILACGGSCE